MVKCSILDWLIFYALPFFIKVPIIKIQFGNTNQIISKEVVIIVSLHNQERSTWERNVEIVALVESWVSVVYLVVFSLVVHLRATFHDKIRVRRREEIFLGKVEAFKHVDSCLGCNFGL